jgi:fucose permease
MAKVSFQRDRLTKITYAQVAAMSWFIFGMGPAFALLREDLGVTRTVMAFHNVSGSVGSILAGLTSTYLIHKFGRGNVIRSGAMGMIIGLLLFVNGPTINFTIPSMFICGYSGILIIQCNAAFLNNHHGEAAPAAISEVNALGALVGFIAPIILGVGIATGFGWRIGLGWIVLAFLAIELFRGRDTSAFGSAKTFESSADHDQPGPLPKLYWAAWLAISCTTAIEASTLTWASELLRVQSGLSIAFATGAVGTVVLGMAIGRFLGSRLVETHDVEKLYRLSLLLTLLSFIVFWQGQNQYVQLPALGLMGLFMSVHFPLGITRMMRASQGRTDRAAAMFSVGSGSAAGFIPFLVGATADFSSMALAFAIPGLALTLALVLAVKNPVPAGSIAESEIGL